MSPGFYIVKRPYGKNPVSLLWIYTKKKAGQNVLMILEDNGIPRQLRKSDLEELQEYEVLETLNISRNDLKVEKSKINVKFQIKGYDFEWSAVQLVGLYKMLELLPGLAKDLGITNLLKKIENESPIKKEK